MTHHTKASTTIHPKPLQAPVSRPSSSSITTGGGGGLDRSSLAQWLETLGVEDLPLGTTPTNWLDLAEKLTVPAAADSATGAPVGTLDDSPYGGSEGSVTQRATAPLPSNQGPSMIASDPLRLINPATQQSVATELASQATTLEELRCAVENFAGCPLKKTATTTVFSDGNPDSGIMFIGEAPGAEEDAQGKPFVGLSGKLLSKALATIGLVDRSSYYITNTIPWRPPGNRQPTAQELAACLPFLRRHIALVDPRLMVFVGATAAKNLLQTATGVTKLRGHFFDYHCPLRHTITQAFVLYHPAYLLRSPSKKDVFWRDLLVIKKYLDGPA